MARLIEALHSGRVLLMDGAMGTELQRAGIGEECYELWNLTHPEKVLAIHRAYVAAGAEVLLTNTFQANPKALERWGCADRLGHIFAASMDLARQAAGPERFVVLDVGPLDDARSMGEFLATAGASADAILLETQSKLSPCIALASVARLPVFVSFAFLRTQAGDLQTGTGLSPQDVALLANDLGASALGVNCGREISVEDCAEVLRCYRMETDLPLFARPNAGTPRREGEHWVYPRSPEGMAAALPDLLAAGAVMIGGCCGTTPDHIAAFRSVIDHKPTDGGPWEPGAGH